MNKCFDYEIARDTGGQPIMKRMCYCETTCCCQKKEKIDFSKLDKYGIDQKKSYKEFFKTKLL